MKGGKERIALFVLVLLFTLSIVNAISATLITGSVRLGYNSTPTVISRSIGVRNDNNKTAYVFFEPGKEINDSISMEAVNISLAPGEQRFVKFNLTLSEPKSFDSKIIALFSTESTQTILSDVTFDKLAVEMKVRVVYSPLNNTNLTSGNSSSINPGDENGPFEGNFLFFLFLGGVILAAIVAITLIIFNSKKEKK